MRPASFDTQNPITLNGKILSGQINAEITAASEIHVTLPRITNGVPIVCLMSGYTYDNYWITGVDLLLVGIKQYGGIAATSGKVWVKYAIIE